MLRVRIRHPTIAIRERYRYCAHDRVRSLTRSFASPLPSPQPYAIKTIRKSEFNAITANKINEVTFYELARRRVYRIPAVQVVKA